MQLHKGAKLEEVKQKAKENLKELTPKEIAEVEQELIKEGISRDEIPYNFDFIPIASSLPLYVCAAGSIPIVLL